jgi:hypothetical protein
MDKKLPAKLFSLADSDISSQRCMTRRSLLGALGLGLSAAALAVVGSGPAAAQGSSRCTDADVGRYQDAPGYGIRCRPSGGGRPYECTDNDAGRYEDPPRRGVRCSPGGGSGGARPPACTDSDSGPNEDPVGLGTRCWT